MRVLLDTNVIIHREAPRGNKEDIGLLFRWIDRLHYEKCVHPLSIEEINRHQDEGVRRAFNIKLSSYSVLKSTAVPHETIVDIMNSQDRDENDRIDSLILNEVVCDRVDFLVTEDRKMLKKSERLSLSDRVFAIDAFIEKVLAENPDLTDYSVLSIRKRLFGQIDVHQPFFDYFRECYPGFNGWFNRKADESAYVSYENEELIGFLYIKMEDEREPYSDIVPAFTRKRRLKIGTFRIVLNGYRLGERFLKIVFDNAIRQRVDEIYVTVFISTTEQERLVVLLEEFGFKKYGVKKNDYGDEAVYVRDMTPKVETRLPSITYPYLRRGGRVFLVPIYPEYHTELFPDSILTTESPSDFIESYPHRNAIRKVYISRSRDRNVQCGDVVVFYRTGGYYQGVVTTLGVVEKVHDRIPTEADFIRLCRRRSVFSDKKLSEHWNYSNNRPFIVEFLYVYSFPKRPILKDLIDNGIVSDIYSAPRGFKEIATNDFETIARLSKTDTRIIVD